MLKVMKIIEAMKTLKHLQEKCADLRKKVATYCADLDFETPVYPDQKDQVTQWIQSHQDSLHEIARLRVAIQRTNLSTPVTIEIDGKQVTKSIAEWIHRRKDLAKADLEMWSGLGDRSLREGLMQNTTGGNITVKIRRYFDPKLRDAKVDVYRREPSLIDSTLETVNAVTDVIEQ
ncbi:MAG TPA: hypothetical protein VKX49_12485 [Bryobacteraceae bacterium]|nr:hypothetical protein [Bryobacteraceae bacterium]